jgi:hypothetical protein
MSSIQQLNGRHHDFVNRYWISVSQMTRISSFVAITIQSLPHLWFITGFIQRLTQRVKPVYQEILALHLLNGKYYISYYKLRYNTLTILGELTTRVSGLWIALQWGKYTCSFISIAFIKPSQEQNDNKKKHCLRDLYLTFYWNTSKVIH